MSTLDIKLGRRVGGTVGRGMFKSPKYEGREGSPKRRNWESI